MGKSMNAKIKKRKFNLYTLGCPQRFLRTVPISDLDFLKDHPVAVEKAKRGKWNSLDTT